jgi:uncharacterized protein
LDKPFSDISPDLSKFYTSAFPKENPFMLIETLTQEEARVLGTLIEKCLATPDYYPLTLNSLRTACNQKSNRDPVTEYTDETVTLALNGLKRKVLVTFIPYGSQGTLYKYRHFLEDPRFELDKAHIAILGVLLLRGSQTLNEVKMRASSLYPIDSLEATEGLLTNLSNRTESLVECLPKRPGWKEPRWRDKIREPMEETETSESIGSYRQDDEQASNAISSSPYVKTQREEIEDLKREVTELRETLGSLKQDVEKIKAELY